MTRIEGLTEHSVIERIVPTAVADSVELGPGDDAAVVRLASSRLVISTDTMVAGHDFLHETTLPEWIGHKAAVQNLADIAAMGAMPSAVVAALSAPADTALASVEGIMHGLATRCGRDGVELVGGDLGSADQLTLTITAVGALAEGEAPITRAGARPGDLIAVSGEALGRSAAGLALIMDGLIAIEDGAVVTMSGRARRPERLDALAAQATATVHWHNAPDPDVVTASRGARQAGATAMIDLSDGLSIDAERIGRASGVCIDLDPAALEPDIAALRELAEAVDGDAAEWVLHGGEEHALLAAFPADAVPPGFRPVGTVRARSSARAPGVLLDGEPLEVRAWDHFA